MEELNLNVWTHVPVTESVKYVMHDVLPMAVKISATFTAAFADVSMNKRLFSFANTFPSWNNINYSGCTLICYTQMIFNYNIIAHSLWTTVVENGQKVSILSKTIDSVDVLSLTVALSDTNLLLSYSNRFRSNRTDSQHWTQNRFQNIYEHLYFVLRLHGRHKKPLVSRLTEEQWVTSTFDLAFRWAFRESSVKVQT